MQDKLNHLDSKQIEELIYRYYNEENITELIQEFDINVSPGNLYKCFPSVKTVLKCKYCDSSLYRKQPSRSGSSGLIKFCKNCGHEESNSCNCSNCKEHREYLKKNRESICRNLINDYVDGSNLPKISPENIPLEDEVYLQALIKHSASDDLKYVDPYREEGDPFSPWVPKFEYLKYIVKCLQHSGLIKLSSDSNIDAFVYNEDFTEITGYYTFQVYWELLPNRTLDEKLEFLDYLNKKTISDRVNIIDNDEEIYKIYKDIVLSEVLEFYQFQLEERGYGVEEISPKMISLFKKLMNTLSLGQIFNLSWQTVSQTVDRGNINNTPKYIIRNQFIGNLDRKFESYATTDKVLNNSNRDFKCPQSYVSKYFFENVLNCKDYMTKRFIDIEDELLDRLEK